MHTQQYEALRSALETYMDGVLPLPDALWPEGNMPRTLVEAMRYSLLAGGKRLRPCCCWRPMVCTIRIWHRRCPLQRRWR